MRSRSGRQVTRVSPPMVRYAVRARRSSESSGPFRAKARAAFWSFSSRGSQVPSKMHVSRSLRYSSSRESLLLHSPQIVKVGRLSGCGLSSSDLVGTWSFVNGRPSLAAPQCMHHAS